MSLRRLITIIMLVGWMLVSPVAIAHGGCIGMGMTCDGPCVLTPYALSPLTHLMAPHAGVYLQIARSIFPPTPVVKVLTPPPESLLFSSSFFAVA
jgi:hypothetical protein